MKKIDYRRRKSLKTNYKKRFNLLRSGLPRIVVRVSNKKIIVQYVEHNSKGDNVRSSVTSDVLSKIGIKAISYKNKFCGYLAGYYFGKQALAKKAKKKAILDIGMQKLYKGGRIFSVVQGILDAGFDIPCDKEMLPSRKLILGTNDEKILNDYTKKIDSLKF